MADTSRRDAQDILGRERPKFSLVDDNCTALYDCHKVRNRIANPCIGSTLLLTSDTDLGIIKNSLP